MAVLEMNYKSACLKRFVKIRAIIPFENSDFHYDDKQEYPTLYLLHGFSGNSDDWLLESPIFREARHRKLAVIMPSGENSFYRHPFTSFIGEELIEVSRKIFPLSSKREDTFIAGDSMGGYGALYVGMKYNAVFSKIVSFSGGFFEYLDRQDKELLQRNDPAAFHEIINLFESQKQDDPLSALLSKKNLPQIYLACGTMDPLLKVNRMLAKKMDEMKIPYHYIESEGKHDWDYWSASLPSALDWLLEK